MMFTTAINIGRNIYSTPLSDAAWTAFIQLIAETLEEHSGQTVEVMLGTGSWDGVPEDAASIKTRTATPILTIEEVINRAARIGTLFGQDAVAVEQGTSTLHGGN